MPIRETLRRRLLLPLLLAWSAVVVIAALPREILPAAVEPVPRAVFDALHDARLRPVAHVFEGRRGDLKRRSLMLGVHARYADGRLERVLSVPEAAPEGFVLHRPAHYTLVVKLMGLDLVNRLMRLRSAKSRLRQIRRMRRSKRVARVARFACHSAHAAGDGAERVYLTAAFESISYRTGRVFPAVHTLHIYDCRRDRTVYEPRWPRAELDEGGRPRPVIGELEPLFAASRLRRGLGLRKGWAGSTGDEAGGDPPEVRVLGEPPDDDPAEDDDPPPLRFTAEDAAQGDPPLRTRSGKRAKKAPTKQKRAKQKPTQLKRPKQTRTKRSAPHLLRRGDL